jgi:hypothetical protein
MVMKGQVISVGGKKQEAEAKGGAGGELSMVQDGA